MSNSSSSSSSSYQLTPFKYLSKNEQERLRESLLNAPEIAACYFLTLLETGARLSEGLLIRPSDLIEERSSVFVRGIKGSNDREVAIRPELFERLLRLRSSAVSTLFGFGPSNADRLWRIYRPVPKKCHSLRHTFAVNLLKLSNDLHMVQYALGHKNIQNTMIYLDMTRADDLRRLILSNVRS